MPQEFKLPEVGEGIASGTVVAVLVGEGDRIEVDQPVLELETDKAVVEVPSTVAGVVTKVHVQANAEAKIGQVVLTVDDAADADAAEDAEPEREPRLYPESEPDLGAANGSDGDGGADEAADAASDAAAGAGKGRGGTSDPAAPRTGGGERPASGGAPARAKGDGDGPRGLIPAAPSVRRLARERGVDLRAVAGSGVLGRISADDVVRFAEGGAQAPRPDAGAPAPAAPPLPDFAKWGETERAPMSGIRKATVRSMTQAWATVPMVTHFDEADATEFEALRQRYKDAVQKAGAKLTPTAMLVKVIASALRKFPDFNASLDVASQEVVYKRYVNVGVAVDTDHGLLVPVIKHADRKNVVDLAVELEALAAKARERKLSPDDMSGGNFSVSNLGGIGGTGFTPIVAPPDVAILGVARSAMKPVWSAEAGAFEPRLVMPLALTYDHRLIDGASAARFLRWVCRAVEEPFLIALEG